MPNHYTRRTSLQIGALGLGSLGLGSLMRLRAANEQSSASKKAVIMVYLPGGASHIDMYDMKPDAPAEYRGEFRPIGTNVDGIQICELMPQQAKIADKFTILRGLKTRGNHDPTELLTGIHAAASGRIGSRRRPAIGCVVSKLRGNDGPIPPYVSLSSHKLLPSYDDPEEPAYLGASHRPISVSGQMMKDLDLLPEISQLRLQGRKELLSALQRESSAASLGEVDTYTERALDMLVSSRIRDALDLSTESESIRQKYGEGTDPQAQGLDFLRARRLVEAGVPLVSVAARFHVKNLGAGVNDPGGWDTHAHNFKILRAKLPIYDQAVAALITDLHDRGLADDVAVVIWSEFGRRPKVGNVTPDGRSHWPAAGCALFAGGGLRMGQAIGETDRLAERASARAYHAQDVLATLYHVLGIDLKTTLLDHAGRPQYLLDQGKVIADLV